MANYDLIIVGSGPAGMTASIYAARANLHVLLLDKLAPAEAVLHSACEQARREGNTEALALLLERQRKSKPRGFDRDFDL